MRLVFGLIGLIIGYFLSAIIGFVLLVWAIVDIVLEMLIGERILPGQGYIKRLYDWQVNNTTYVLFASGEWAWLP